MKKFTEELAVLLGDGWMAYSYRRSYGICNRDGRAFWIHWITNTKRSNKVIIRGILPIKGGEEQYCDAQIAFSINKTAEQAAVEINRRFMPVYERELNTISEE